MRARLLGHKEWLEIEPIDRQNLLTDGGDAPAGAIARLPALRLKAQLEEERENTRAPGQGGAGLPVLATATFLARDVRRAGWQPADGDRVIQIDATRNADERPVNWYVTTPRFSGKTHYDNELVIVQLMDRPPSRATSEGLIP